MQRRLSVTPLLDRMRLLPMARGYRIFLNSHFAEEKASAVFGRRFGVLYPPVRTKAFWSEADSRSRRGVVSWGRFAPYKRQRELVEVAARLADSGFEEPFLIMGSTESFPGYYQEVVDLVKRTELSNIRLIPNPTFQEAVKILQSSLIYAHLMIDEPFGITTAEAISAGCIPLVHDSGGQREIVEDPRLRWRHLKELADGIIRIHSNRDDADSVRSQIQGRVRRFDESRFQEVLIAQMDTS